MKSNAIVIAILVLVVAGMLAAGKYLARRQAGSAIQASSGNIRGQLAPDFELADLDGKKVRLSDFKGKAVLLNFWATWCAPCKIEMPWFVELQKQYGPQGLQIIGVALDSDPPDIKKFVTDIGVNYVVLIGNDKVGNLYGGVQGLPTTFYIGRDGKVVSRAFGLISHREIEQNIQAALKQGQAVAGNRTSRTAGGPGVYQQALAAKGGQ